MASTTILYMIVISVHTQLAVTKWLLVAGAGIVAAHVSTVYMKAYSKKWPQ